MKLNILFIVMDLLTILAYPIVFFTRQTAPACKVKRRRYSGIGSSPSDAGQTTKLKIITT